MLAHQQPMLGQFSESKFHVNQLAVHNRLCELPPIEPFRNGMVEKMSEKNSRAHTHPSGYDFLPQNAHPSTAPRPRTPKFQHDEHGAPLQGEHHLFALRLDPDRLDQRPSP
ncbi:MAG: hypothetical protein ACPIOQ_81920, partial [Promethearchaeia archaeon]